MILPQMQPVFLAAQLQLGNTTGKDLCISFLRLIFF
jgi:hypothetical protein